MLTIFLESHTSGVAIGAGNYFLKAGSRMAKPQVTLSEGFLSREVWINAVIDEMCPCLPQGTGRRATKNQHGGRCWESEQINRACWGTVQAVRSIVKGISCHTRCATLNLPLLFILAPHSASPHHPAVLGSKKENFPTGEEKHKSAFCPPHFAHGLLPRCYFSKADFFC